jgi:hypothetical protein
MCKTEGFYRRTMFAGFEQAKEARHATHLSGIELA